MGNQRRTYTNEFKLETLKYVPILMLLPDIIFQVLSIIVTTVVSLEISMSQRNRLSRGRLKVRVFRGPHAHGK
jgi:hypothetical protein